MPRYKLTIEYDGTHFNGWQSQADRRAVQDALSAAIEGFCGEKVTVFGAGRTDSGVHALGQVAHIDLEKEAPPDKLRDAVNFHLKPHAVAVLAAEKVGEDFDARFSARRRHYSYRIINRRAPLTVDKDRAWLVHAPLDAGAMHEAGQVLIGKHDFTTFRSAHCQAKSPVKTMDEVSVSRYGEEIEIVCRARSFLHNQVRSIVGSLKQVGEGRWSAADMRRALEAADRAACGPVAPPQGLYLFQVDYE
ncbi:tRNA pseudouridine synthase A [Tepidicaulis marinus]|uniref:tRNA pseudouridine synthase A n=1 Tax=Tepidicaulis marinus TaxID=1333998 RepID=A0A081BB88_9HYPH|nr:tRNA pseudouridine(38-40) synthase TruA [Tepidicaulis marinus]GAK45306.1 tRNA pseudouridine synthase A [Tepidicaulis marinus]